MAACKLTEYTHERKQDRSLLFNYDGDGTIIIGALTNLQYQRPL